MSGRQVKVFCSAPAIESWLKQHTRLSAANRRSLTGVVPKLLSRIPESHPASIGISGAPGSGKSTLARTLTHCLSKNGVATCLLSLDDYYFSQSERAELAGQVHPLLRHRGVPGTHDLARLLADHDQLRRGDIVGLRLPVFDKSLDDRRPESLWRTPESAPQVIIIEGWCIGAGPQSVTELEHPVNHFERLRDPDLGWRRYVNEQSRIMDDALRKRLDEVWYIRVPDWDCVIQWRWQQEQELAAGRLKSRDEVQDFLASFERIFRHMQANFPQWTDQLIAADREHDFRIGP